ncbi:hypothetical protein Mal52_43960 [Symmachiella dynata]|uniref:Ferritin-like domain protein n=1 Tax=Symmachiella dynata TaxID=2527995 RepID=A0A517ZTU9_9PLAN|nr:hypothetical protein [Symmachiella dynata]QDU45899.1 hypothetical protein Mal52_43960 [Symmachiella dynata]
MPELQNACLNEVLIRILRGLLQYAGECWPWSSAEHGEEYPTIARLVAEQQEQVQELADLITERGALVDFGTYPTEFTDLNYVSLDYLLDALVQEQVQLLADVRQAMTDCAGDPEGLERLEQIAKQAQQHLDTLSELAAARTADSST